MAKLVRFPTNSTKQEALALQRHVFVQQLKLAARYQRPVSVHCVQQHGVLLECFQSLLDDDDDNNNDGNDDDNDNDDNDNNNQTNDNDGKEKHFNSNINNTTPSKNNKSDNDNDEKRRRRRRNNMKRLPPAIALHSFTGTAHQIQQLLQWERESFYNIKTDHARKFKHNKKKTKKDDDDDDKNNKTNGNTASTGDTPPLFYFGFSHSVNYAMCSSEKSRRQGVQAIGAVPTNRLLIESDVHASDNLLGGTVGALSYVTWALQQHQQQQQQKTQQRTQQQETNPYRGIVQQDDNQFRLAEVAQQTHINALRFLANVRKS